MSHDEAALENLDIQLPDIFIWRELAIIGLIFMDISWGVIWVDVLTSLQDGVTLFDLYLVVGAAMLGAHLLSRGMIIFNLKVWVQRAVFIAFFLLVTAFGFRTLLGTGVDQGVGEFITEPVASFTDLGNLIPTEFILILSILFFGYRGIKLSQEFIGPLKVFAHFRLGFLMFLIYVAVITTLSGLSPGVTWIIFLTAGLMALASARVALLAIIRGGRKNPFNREWFLGLTLAIGGAILLSAGIAVLAAG
ncbi:MAG: hypothetical protein R3335_14625, partial [Anaerolineales bacterium]|nr:hypothetical protein [Anaerolineales bacterium]